MSPRITRRDFIKGSAIGVGSLLILRDSRSAFGFQANEKLNIALIGAGGKGHANLDGVSSENIVALCDVDARRAADAFNSYPKAAKFTDFRKMLDKMGKQIDAVVVSTPDHTHAIASIRAMEMGKHVYCEKPLTHTISEARLMRETARKHKVATQMGNQGTAGNGLREAVEVIRAGCIGQVREVHIWSNRPVWPQGVARPTEVHEIPKELEWDLWLGPAEARRYNQAYLPFVWRGWKAFGTGAIGDMGCHTMNLTYMALKLNDPISVEAECFEGTDESYPKRSIVRYTFPARGNMPPCKLTWYDGGLKPPAWVLPGREMPGSGCVMVTEKGLLFSPDDYGWKYELIPEGNFTDLKKPDPTLPRSPGHYAEWIAACKGGQPALSNFDYASGLTEMALLGNLAVLVGEPIYWDPKGMRAINCPKADAFVTTPYRKGWPL